MSLEQLCGLVAHVTDPAYGNAYRELYGLHGNMPLVIKTFDEWRVLPFLTKDVLIAKNLDERSFLPVGKLDHLRASSGTSGKPPLFSPRTHVRRMEYRLAYHDFANAFLAFTVPMMPHWHEMFQKENGALPRVVCYDPQHPMASAYLAKAAGVDGLSVFVYHIPHIGEAMKRAGMNKQIRFVEITGETCSPDMYAYIRQTFPNATILQSYNASEVEDAHIGMPCKIIDGSEPLAVYHAKETHYLELVDPETGAIREPRAGTEGDLILSAYPGEPSGFPLVRFRIGDTVRVVEERCAHGSWSFTVLGRTDMDFVKVPGGILRADEIERVLRLFPERANSRFEAHCFEEAGPRGPVIRLELHVESQDADLETLAEDVSRALRVAPSSTYSDGVAQGRFLPLRCVPLTTQNDGKRKRMIRHASAA